MIDYLILFIVGVLWGSTNYLIEIYYYDYDQIDKKTNFFKKAFSFLLLNYKPLLFFLLNQIGSILFYFSLKTISLSLTVIVSNSVSFISTMLCEHLHKRKSFHLDYYFGILLVCSGMSLCLYNS